MGHALSIVCLLTLCIYQMYVFSSSMQVYIIFNHVQEIQLCMWGSLQVATTFLVCSATGRTNSGFALVCGHFSRIQIIPTNAHVRDVMTANDQAECNVALKHHVVVLRKVQYWQLIGIPRPISSYCFYKDIFPPLTYCSCQHCTYMWVFETRISDGWSWHWHINTTIPCIAVIKVSNSLPALYCVQERPTVVHHWSNTKVTKMTKKRYN